MYVCPCIKCEHAFTVVGITHSDNYAFSFGSHPLSIHISSGRTVAFLNSRAELCVLCFFSTVTFCGEQKNSPRDRPVAFHIIHTLQRRGRGGAAARKDLAWSMGISHILELFFFSAPHGCVFVCARMVYFIFPVCTSMELSFVSAQGWVNIFGETCALGPSFFGFVYSQICKLSSFQSGPGRVTLWARQLRDWMFVQSGPLKVCARNSMGVRTAALEIIWINKYCGAAAAEKFLPQRVSISKHSGMNSW
jgi:hypothetical protein